jgi:hypothetical protein
MRMGLDDICAAFTGLLTVYDEGEFVEVKDFAHVARELLTLTEAPPGEGDPDPGRTEGLTTILLRALQEYGDAPVALMPSPYGGAKGYSEAGWVAVQTAHPLRDGEGHKGYDGEWQPGDGRADDDRTIVVIGR